MRGIIKQVIYNLFYLFIKTLIKFKLSRYLLDQFVLALMSQKKKIYHNDVGMTFLTPNSMSFIRADTFSIKEPETLEWIDEMEEGSLLWDIGANVGIYSCYAAKHKKCHVYAFEPSVFNLELLARNIHVNKLVDKVSIIPIPLSDGVKESKFKMKSTKWGGAISTFGESYTHDGTHLKESFEYKTVGLSMLNAMNDLKILQPHYIKMDVDGIEHLILKGGMKVLLGVKSVLVEVNDDFKYQSKMVECYLKEAGFILKKKEQAKMFAGTSSFNQIWHKE